jgi:hypothetical protein
MKKHPNPDQNPHLDPLVRGIDTDLDLHQNVQDYIFKNQGVRNVTNHGAGCARMMTSKGTSIVIF